MDNCKKNCSNCKHRYKSITEEPCMTCVYNEEWEPAKQCDNCMYSDIPANCGPCSKCQLKEFWVYKEEDNDNRTGDS